jgi:archaemetzincin
MRLATLGLLTLPCIAMGFTPSDENTVKAAIGDLSRLPPTLQRAFVPDPAAFQPIPEPGPDDWLAVHPESGQTFDQFKNSQANRPGQQRNVVYLQPLGDFPAERSPSMDKLREFAAAFFAMEVKTLPPVAIDKSRFTTRHNQLTGNPQILTGDVLSYLQHQLPSNSFCLLAVTMKDLYPDPSWNFVFGQASLRERVGVYSFARYLPAVVTAVQAGDPAFYPASAGQPSDYQTLLLRRSCKVLAHEAGHMFGLAHCTFFNCLMNGSNHLAESDRRPLHLCPVCLRKLQWSVGFDVVKRYQAIEKIDRDLGFADEADWLQQRIKSLR